MSAWSKTVFLCATFLLWLLPSCTYYTEKQTEAVSQTVYATKDSIDKARFDLADEYSTQATRLIKPPKKRIEVSYLRTTLSNVVQSKNSNTKTTVKTPVVVIPERLRGMTVIVVNSEEYKLLLEDKESHEQLKIDHELLGKAKEVVDNELSTQIKFRDKMIIDLNTMKEQLAKKDSIILKLTFTAAALGFVLVGCGYLRIKGIL